MAEERKVYTFEAGKGFAEMEDTPPVAKIETPPKEAIVAEAAPIENQPPVETPPVETPPVQATTEETPPVVPEGVEETPPGIEDKKGEELPNPGEDETVPPNETDPEEDKGEGEGVPTEIPQTDDFFVAAATRLKASGVLPKEFELPEDLTEDQADQAIYDAYVENLKPEANKELLGEFQTEMKKRGWTEDTLTYASLLQNGVRPDQIAQMQDYKTLAEVDASKMDDESKENYVRQMYVDRGWKEKEIKRVIDSAGDEGEIDSLVADSLAYFGQRQKKHEEEQFAVAQRNKEQQDKIQQYKQGVVSHLFDKKEIGGERLTDAQLDSIETALFERNVPVQYEGQVVNLTKYEQFESALEQDFQLRLWAFKKFMFREQEAESYKQQALVEAEEARIVKWGKGKRTIKGAPEVPAQEQKTVITNNRLPKTSQTDGSSYVFEGGEFKPVPK